ncbi:hypothetical protein GQ44DRAFT_704838 [Phaeosphaeriaceae sp. PMI808]|nr:hypothetical protein GQ44DRAFT_704838 [Phaeosphaeriaceae sp. PMI808]
MLFAVSLANAVIALVVGPQGVGSINSVENGNMLCAMIPLPFCFLASNGTASVYTIISLCTIPRNSLRTWKARNTPKMHLPKELQRLQPSMVIPHFITSY